MQKKIQKSIIIQLCAFSSKEEGVDCIKIVTTVSTSLCSAVTFSGCKGDIRQHRPMLTCFSQWAMNRSIMLETQSQAVRAIGFQGSASTILLHVDSDSPSAENTNCQDIKSSCASKVERINLYVLSYPQHHLRKHRGDQCISHLHTKSEMLLQL